MNSFASISLIFLFLFKGLVPNLDFCCELQKLPNLFEHYEEHKTYSDDSFWEFLVADYLDHDDNTQDHHNTEHDNLPFHGSHQCGHTSVFHGTDQHSSLAVFEFVPQIEYGYYNPFHPSEFLDSLFQPPQV